METGDMSPQEGTGEKRFGKDALLVAGAVLLAGLIIAGSVVAATQKLSSPSVTTAQPAAAPTADKGAQQPSDPSVTLDQIKGLFNGKNISFGKKDSKVLFVEFSDPSCPFCQVAAGKNPNLNKQIGAQFTLVSDGGSYVAPVPEMRKLVDAGKAAFVWIYTNGHGNGEMGTKALYCAQEKKKFWEVHDLLMSEAGYNMMNTDVKNDKTKSGVVADFLKNAVSASDMKSCLDSGKYDSRIVEDTATASQFGLSGTPKFFINTENFKGAYSFKDMQASVDKYLK
ncbi:MAG: DsbA family protein [Candidatus Moraniibacteriota bacterium]